MKYAELSIDRELDFMSKHTLTPDELYLIRLIFYAQDGHDEYIKRFFSENELTHPLRDVLLSLQEKGIINKSYFVPEKGTVFNPKDVDFNKNVIKSFLQHSNEMGMELFMSYPATIVINGKTFSLRNIAKLYKSFDDFCFAYGRVINFSPEKHQEIIELVNWGKENNLINSGLTDFITSMGWVNLKELKDSDMGIFNTNTLI